MMKKLAISMRVTQAPNYFEERNSIAFNYIEFFEKLGFILIPIPVNTTHISSYFENFKFDGIVLSGGNNVNPKLYKSNVKLEDVYEKRDDIESKLVSFSINNNIPVLGICRGMQYLNVHFGGSISQNFNGHVNISHKLISSLKRFDNMMKNSFHNHCILKNDVSNDFNILATTDDNVVEAIEHKKNKILGIQWHPEREIEDNDYELIRTFLNESNNFSGRNGFKITL